MTARHTIQELLDSLPFSIRHIAGDIAGTAAPAHAICCDSRQVAAECLFVCIAGAQSDGHRYIKAAYLSGCRVFLVQTGSAYEPLPQDAAVFETDDTRNALAHLACAFYDHPARDMRVVGITGTKGKTTVAMMCYHILKRHGEAVGYIGTSGVLFGEIQKQTCNTTPGALELQGYLSEMKQAGITTVLLEVSSQALWQRRVDGIPFAVCALTNLYPDHIGAPEHPTFEHYANCKRHLLTHYDAPLIIGNADDPHTPAMCSEASGNIVLCGIRHAADLYAENIHEEKEGALPQTSFTCHDEHGASLLVRLTLPGEHNVYNALFALAIVRALGLSLADAAEALTDVQVSGRFELLEVRGALVVIDYAHNGASLRAALTTLRAMHPSRLFCLFGSVGGRTQCRRAELGAVADELADFSYLTADNPDFEPVADICRNIAAAFRPRFLPNYVIIPDRAEAIRTALDELSAGDILLIAGKGDECCQRIDGRDIPYRDRDVVEKYIASLALSV